MRPYEIFQIWAPTTSIWSPWAKPVLFAQINGTASIDLPPDELILKTNIDWLSTIDKDHTAIIVNLAGLDSITMGLALAHQGYRAVPLYNCCDGPGAVVPVRKIQE